MYSPAGVLQRGNRPRAGGAYRSVIVPVYNGAATIEFVVDELLRSPADVAEIILVNDGSTDDSERVCCDLVEAHPGRVMLVQLGRNFGEHAAVVAGLCHCSGSWAAIVDDDGQQSADDVARLFAAAEAGEYDVVYGRYQTVRQRWHRRWLSGLHHHTAGWLLAKPRGLYLSSFKVVNRFVIEQVERNAGSVVYLDGLILAATDRIAQLDVNHRDRRSGRSGYTLAKLFRLWSTAVVGFSAAPSMLAQGLGLTAVLWAVAEFVALLFGNAAIPSAAQRVSLGLLLLGGVMLVYLGLIVGLLRRRCTAAGAARPFVVRYVYREATPHA